MFKISKMTAFLATWLPATNVGFQMIDLKTRLRQRKDKVFSFEILPNINIHGKPVTKGEQLV